jgi:hypothetical protein
VFWLSGLLKLQQTKWQQQPLRLPMNQSKFKKLQELWDRKLAESGFVDIEERETERLRTHSGSNVPERLWAHGGDLAVYKAEYFRQCRLFLHHHRWHTVPKTSKAIWALHAEGVTNREIARQLVVSTGNVQRVIEKTRAKMMKVSL